MSPVSQATTVAAALSSEAEDPPLGGAGRPTCASPVQPARRSSAARAKAAGKRTPDGVPAHSIRTLLADLATLIRTRLQPVAEGAVGAGVFAS